MRTGVVWYSRRSNVLWPSLGVLPKSEQSEDSIGLDGYKAHKRERAVGREPSFKSTAGSH
ncbi:hypothetical protein LK12_05255 [Novosphingobium malaysiense]|uniref:Uncharacterized protein n=1 Tax=Novosphingobium malaysiense TaxID=1348853 RepID=A0A0B1ZT16_9SPHN|nr:hypothetical protein LK12_05255 [Novosphingobium malaysiense]